ncbi:uncharacterized protein LOC126565719 [Anopheles maculipalpis]|uniref:uncharacterized protein LOC126565719 n=1 Tax=Anopheles maculipalpis TaxID=1496333 RepID=UPI002159325B|nr:uncharacterized protein LOC126565719 [Anopheles maculipalpis]
MDNLRNLFGQVSAMTSMKPSTASPSFSVSSSASPVSGSVGGAGRSGSVGGGVNGTMRTHKTADRDSYYYIMWRS